MNKTAADQANRLHSPRQYRALQELMKGPRSVRQLFNSTGANGVPQLIVTLKAKGLQIETCEHIGKDRDGRPTRYAVYVLSEDSRRLALSLLSHYAG